MSERQDGPQNLTWLRGTGLCLREARRGEVPGGALGKPWRVTGLGRGRGSQNFCEGARPGGEQRGLPRGCPRASAPLRSPFLFVLELLRFSSCSARLSGLYLCILFVIILCPHEKGFAVICSPAQVYTEALKMESESNSLELCVCFSL